MAIKKFTIFLLLILLTFNSTPPSIAISDSSYSNKTIKIAGDNNYPPYEYLDSNGYYKGFNVDIITAVAIELGWDIELIPTSWENAMNLLKSREVDAIQGMTLTPERDKTYDFTQNIVVNSQSIFVLKNTSYISELSDLEGKKVSVQAEDVTTELLKEIPNIVIIEKVNQLEAIKALLNNEVDAFFGNRLTGIYNIQRFGFTELIKTVGEPVNDTIYSMAVASGNEEMLTQLNLGIEAIKKNGTYDKIYKKWFGETFVDVNENWRNLLFILLIILLISLAVLVVIYFWNKNLKLQVENRTKELHHSNRFRGKVIDSIIDGFVAFDSSCKVIQYNAFASYLLQKDIYEGEIYEELIDGKIPIEAVEFVSSGKTWNGKLEWKSDNESIRYVDCSLTPINGPATSEGFILSISDRTQEIELYNMAKHNDKMQSLGVLSAGLAHELRNPLTAIKTFIDLIPMKIENEDFRKELLNIVPRELARLNDLVSSLLNYSKPKNPKPKKIKLDNVLDEVLILFKKNLQEKSIKITKNNTDIYLFVDESQLKQILINIIINSIDAIESDGLINIESMVIEKKASIIISDNGIGIPKEILNKLFEPFYSSKSSGYGIGLSITERLIKENNGAIKIYSEVGLGTKVIIQLPTQIPIE